MRSILKPAMGGALAVLLALSASPAMATDGLPDAQDETTVVVPEDPTSESATNDTSESEQPAAEPESEAVEPTVEQVEELSPATASQEHTTVPETVPLEGRVLLIQSETNDSGESFGGGVLIATDQSSLVPVDQASFGGTLVPGAEFSGTVTLDADARAAVAEELEVAGSLSSEEVLATANASVLAAETAFAVQGEIAPSSATREAAPEGSITGAAPAKLAHKADVVYFKRSGEHASDYNSRRFTKSSLTKLISQTASYWKTQSAGAVSSFAIDRFTELNPEAPSCNPEALWDQAADAFGASSTTYAQTRHLVVLVDSSEGCDGAAGLADIGRSTRSGGVIWVDLYAAAEEPNASEENALRSTTTLAHELGHNLSLGHAQSRLCSGKAVDARTEWRWDEQNYGRLQVKAPIGGSCKDLEYGDVWNLMGGGPATSKAPSLGVAQRTALGVNPVGSVKTVTAAGGKTQTVKLYPLGGTTGVRGIRIANPTGEDYFVEYRTAVGSDAEALGGSLELRSEAEDFWVSAGVLVTKGYAAGRMLGEGWQPYPVKRSTVIPHHRADGKRNLTSVKNGVTTPIDSISRVRVTDIAADRSYATVSIEFAPFTDVTYQHKFSKEITWMSAEGLSNGYASGSTRVYQPAAPVTREAMAAFLYRLNTPDGAKGPAGYTVPKVSPFRDVPTNHKFYKEIAWMYESKLSTGTKQPTGKPIYAPKAAVTREAMAAFIYRMDDKPKGDVSASTPFVDVPSSHKFYREIAWMFDTKLSTGTKQPSGKPKYGPRDAVTREAMAAFIFRYEN